MYIFGNENKIAQVFDNLIQNAVSFSTDKQIINIRLEKSLEHIIILLQSHLHLSPEKEDHPFQPFDIILKHLSLFLLLLL